MSIDEGEISASSSSTAGVSILELESMEQPQSPTVPPNSPRLLEVPHRMPEASQRMGENEKKMKHISLQSMVDSISGPDPWAELLYGSGYALPNPNTHQNRRSAASSGRGLLGSTYDLQTFHGQLDMNHSIPPVPPVPPLPPKLVSMSMPREILFVGVCAVSHLMTQAALGQALAPMDLIAVTFGEVSPGQMSWFIAGYSLTVGTFIMISGQLGDIFGHKRMFILGYAWLGMWSCFCGFSAYVKSQIFFDICRAMQGVGPALLMPNALALFGRAYAPGSIRKNIVFSIFGSLAPAGFVIGATFGGLFAQKLWWPWAFWSFGIVAFALGALATLVIPAPLSERPSIRPKFDWAGSALVVAGLVLINVSFNNGPLYGWGTPHVYFTLIIGVMCCAGFAWVELRAPNPLLPLRALNSTVGYVLALVGLGWGSFGIWVFYNVRFLQHIRHATPLAVAAQYSPAAVAGLVAAGMTGFMLTHTPVSFVMMVSMIPFLAGIIITCFQPAQQIYWAQTFVAIIIMPFGMDMSFPAATVILSNHMPREHQGLAASLVNTVVNYSISIALGIAGSVEVYAPVKNGDLFEAYRNAFYSAIGVAGLGVILGIAFFLKTVRKEGWVVMAH